MWQHHNACDGAFTIEREAKLLAEKGELEWFLVDCPKWLFVPWFYLCQALIGCAFICKGNIGEPHLKTATFFAPKRTRSRSFVCFCCSVLIFFSHNQTRDQNDQSRLDALGAACMFLGYNLFITLVASTMNDRMKLLCLITLVWLWRLLHLDRPATSPIPHPLISSSHPRLVGKKRPVTMLKRGPEPQRAPANETTQNVRGRLTCYTVQWKIPCTYHLGWQRLVQWLH